MRFVDLSIGGRHIGNVSEALARAIQELVVLHELEWHAAAIVAGRNDAGEEYVRLVSASEGEKPYRVVAAMFQAADTAGRVPMRLPDDIEYSHASH